MRYITIVALLAFAAACSNSSSGDLETEKTLDEPNLPPPTVSLPDPPPASAYEIPEKNGDGTLRVEGLLFYKDKYLDKQVTVSGTIVRMSPECDPAKAKKAGTECPEPNLFIRDAADAELALRVVGYKPEFVKKAKLAEGDQRSFTGTYRKVAAGFVATEDGLLLVDMIDDMSVLDAK